ncbi:hypothetical protein M9458_049869, partial [Cirrhinus mrigala]
GITVPITVFTAATASPPNGTAFTFSTATAAFTMTTSSPPSEPFTTPFSR